MNSGEHMLSLIILLGVVGLAGAQVVPVELNDLQLTIDQKTGSLVRIAYPATGEILSTAPETAGLLDVAYPAEHYPQLRLASRFSQARITRTANAVSIYWDQLGPSRAATTLKGGPVSAVVTIRPAPDGRSLIFQCRIENKSEAAIRQVMFPDLWGLKPIEGANGTRLRLARGVVEPFAEPVVAPGRAPFYIERGWRSYPAGGYYAENALRWLDYGGFRGGISIFERKWGTEDRPNVRTFRSEKDPLSLRLLFEHVVAIAPGQTWSSGEFWMTPHRGGWAKGIEVYRGYVKQVSPPRPVPRHVRDGIGFQTVWMMQPLERDPARAAFRFRDFPRVAGDALRHGIDQIVPWGWCSYFSIPVPLNELLGTRQEFLDGIRAARKMGVDIAPFTSIQTLLNQYAGRYGVKPSTGNWTYDPELIPNFRPSYVRAFDGAWVESENREWQKDALSTMTDWVNAGMSSFSWDQFSSKSVHGQKPDIVAIFDRLRALARAKDPESTASAESISAGSFEHDGAVLDFTWNWVEYVDAGPILNVLRAPRLNTNVEDSPLVVKKGFIDGLYLNVMPRGPDQPNGTALISQQPRLAAALKEVSALRRQFLAYFVDGVFLGDSILSQPAPGFVKAYQLGDRLLILALNDSSEPRRLTIPSDLTLWLSSTRAYKVTRYGSTGKATGITNGQGPQWLGVTPQLEPLDLALFEIETI